MKKRRVMGFGTFDAFHPGHLFYLKQLKVLGGELFIVIARDKNVERIKGKAPHFKEMERLSAVEEAGIADRVILGHESDFFQVLREHAPDILGFGYDQRVDIEAIQADFPHIEIARLEAHQPHRFKSSLIKAERFGL
jgi:FAD synthetase